MEWFQSILPDFSKRELLNLNFKITNPITPETKEANKIINLALLMISWFLNANNVMKIDMVKPIPPKTPAPKILFQFNSLLSLHQPIFTATKQKRKIPKGFQSSNLVQSQGCNHNVIILENQHQF